MAKFAHYQSFIAVIEAGSLSGAAKALNMTPSAVGKQISALEQAVGVTLLHRTHRDATPTPLGVSFYERCKAIVAEVDRAEAELRRQTAGGGRLRITMSKTLRSTALFDAVLAFFRARPEFILDLSVSDRVEDIHRENFDFAFRLGVLTDATRLTATRLGRTKIAFCAAPTYVQRCGRPSTLADFAQHRLMLPPPEDLSQQLRRLLKTHEVTLPLEAHHRADDFEIVRHAVLAGLCIGLLPTIAVRDELVDGRLVDLFETEPLIEKDVYLVSRLDDRDSPLHASFRAAVKDAIR